MTEEEKILITREKHPGLVAQGYKLAALMKKRKEEILSSKEQSTEQSTEQPSVQSNGAYVYGVGILAVLVIGACVPFTCNKKAGQVIHEEPIKPKRHHILLKRYMQSNEQF